MRAKKPKPHAATMLSTSTCANRRCRFAAARVVFATGWRPYDAAKIDPYGYSRYANVITSMEFERMLDPTGPTGGKLLRPSDGKAAKDIAFIQCAGSRDKNHLAHCSRICCMASLKQTQYVSEMYGDDAGAKSTIYYIDIRTIDRFEDFERRVRQDKSVHFIKSKVANIAQDPATQNPVLHGVDTHGYQRYANAHDLAVLAVGMQPSVNVAAIIAEDARGGVGVDASGFIEVEPADGMGDSEQGVFGAGCASNALDVNRSVQGATAAALRAISVVNRVSAGGLGGLSLGLMVVYGRMWQIFAPGRVDNRRHLHVHIYV